MRSLRVRERLPFLALIVLFVCSLLAHFIISGPRQLPFQLDSTAAIISSVVHFPIEPLAPSCGDAVKLLVMVITRPDEAELRKRIRSSWASEEVCGESTRAIFLTGRTTKLELFEELAEEGGKQHDIVQADVPEGYYNLSMKTYAALKWKQARCPQVRCFVKADSDNVLNIRNFVKKCDEFAGEAVVFGKCDVSRKVIRRASKWAVPHHVLPLSRYPQYCSTGVYAIAGAASVDRLLHVVDDSDFFRNINLRLLSEDVLFAGIFPELASIPRRTVPGISFFARPEYGCERKRQRAYALHMGGRPLRPSWFLKLLNAYEGSPC